MKKQKEFWKWNDEEMCSIAGVRTLASQLNGGVLPSKVTVRKWMTKGLMYHSYISRSYTFRVETVKKFLENLDKPKEMWGFKKEVING